MSRSINKLTARQVATLEAPGRHADGGGLYLRITSGGSRSWVFIASHGGKRIEIDLGGASSVSLATARCLASKMRGALAIGHGPLMEITHPVAEEPSTMPTFGDFAERYITSVESNWKNAILGQEWRNTLRDHARLLSRKPVDQIGTDDVLAVLKPIWLRLPQTANRVRRRIVKILDAAKTSGFRSKDALNPAAWRGHLALLLPAPSKLDQRPRPALPWKEAPTFMAELGRRQALAARCLEFVILTAARRGEGLGSTWGEIDLDAKLWSIPATRMGSGVEHAVPLSSAAIELLNDLRPEAWQPDMRVFAVNGAPLSEGAMSMLLRRMKRNSVTTDGFRSMFKDWAGDATDYPRELVEQALAHAVPNKAEQVGKYGAAIGRRRELMETWSEFLNSQI
ncbi:MAG: integrase arm-type DNA-binding domain-containing protein [Luteimonas sp.]|nr:integrase arm-type DNA-binding domain-containing protein [Luteimonas sp.]